MIRAMGNVFDRWARKWMPDPMLFAILLTFLTYILGLSLTKSGPFEMVQYWYKGFWVLLKFGMQMCLILVTGHALATSPIVRKGIEKLAAIPSHQTGAIFLVALTAAIASWVNWGLGIIVGALMAREVGRSGHLRNIPMHYPLLGAAGYAGFLTWHGGLSASAPLLVATKGHFLMKDIGIIPTSQTLFSPLNIVVTLVLLAVIPLTMMMMSPKNKEDIVTITDVDLGLVEEEKVNALSKEEMVIADKIENSQTITWIIGLMGLAYIFWYFGTKGFKLNLNIVNFTFLFVGIILQRTPINYIKAVSEGTKACSGIIIQFPFYAGIMGMMKFSGLVAVIAGWFVAVSNTTTYPVFAFLSAGLVNLFVPSGGGQMAVQGPVMVQAAQALHFSIPKTVMAIAYGDQWTNMLQPFWALALLGITRLRARDIVGYTMVVLVTSAVVFILGLLLLPA
ncbi:MAG: short-chain fatty acid transporter [Syntrophobacterales bacterium]|nr:short-chain fatty acid transporter [Syntrophobacterales bacterium]